MLEWAKNQLYSRSSDEWSYNTLEADPLIHLLIEACASEAKQVYETIQESDDRLLDRLLKYLLPECFHLPHPAVAVAKASTRVPSCIIPDTQTLVFKKAEKSLYFTPLFETKLINAKIRFVCTDTEVFDQTEQPSYAVDNDPKEVTRLLIGIEAPKPVSILENLMFYVDWKGDTLEKRQLLSVLSKSQWTCNEQLLKSKNGFLDAQALHWKNHFDPEKQLAYRVNAQYQQNFFQIEEEDTTPNIEMNVADVLQTWLNEAIDVDEVSRETTAKWKEIEGHFIWLRIQLPYRITLTDIRRHLIFAFNHFIIVNRYLQEKDDIDTYFSRSFGTEVIRISPKSGLFHSVRKVFNQIKNIPIPALPLAQLMQDKNVAAYSFRQGGVGRMDSYNAWERLSYLLTLFRQEQRYKDLADRLGSNVSLEELHEIIGNLVSKQKAKQADSKLTQSPIYLFIQPGSNETQLRVKISYWTTNGKVANGLPMDTNLESTPPIAGLNPASIRLVTTTVGGKNSYSTTEQIQALQDTLYRRNRIVSAYDVKSLCYQKIGEALEEVTVGSFFEKDRNPDGGGIRRAIEVRLKVKDATDPFIQQLGQEIELTLQEESVGTMPYRVIIF